MEGQWAFSLIAFVGELTNSIRVDTQRVRRSSSIVFDLYLHCPGRSVYFHFH